MIDSVPMLADQKDTTSILMAMVAGAGFILLMVVFFMGAVDLATRNTLQILFLFGAFLLLAGFVSWLYRRQPFRHFDDINIPLEEEAH